MADPAGTIFAIFGTFNFHRSLVEGSPVALEPYLQAVIDFSGAAGADYRGIYPWHLFQHLNGGWAFLYESYEQQQLHVE